MYSFKTLGRILIITAVFTILFTVGINIQTQKAFEILEQNEIVIDEVKEYMNKNAFPIRVFANIAAQTVDSDEKFEALSSAYLRNKATLERNLTQVKDISSRIEFQTYELLVFNLKSDEKESLRQKLDEILNRIEVTQGLLETNFSVPIIRNADLVSDFELQFEKINEDLAVFHDIYNGYSSSIRSNYFMIYNVLITGAMILIGMMAFVVFRIIRKDLKFITKTYKHLDEHNYDLSHLIPEKVRFEEEQEVYNTVERLFKEQQIFTDFKNLVSQSYHLDDILEMLFDKLSDLMDIDRIGIAFVDYRKNKIIAEYGVATYDQIKIGPGFEVSTEKTSLKKQLKTPMSLINNDIPASVEKKPHSVSLNLIAAEGIKSNMIIPLVTNNVVFGFIFISSSKLNHFTDENLKFASKIIYEISGALNRSYLLKVVLSKMTTTFAKLVDRKDNETGDHILRMVSYSKIIAEGLRKMDIGTHPVDRRMILEIERNASVHDIGKVGIPDKILKKPGKLTPEEWQIMKTHVMIGGEIFADLRRDLGLFEADFYKVPEEIVKFHHEKFDGSGYPYRLSGSEIPLVARIVALGDVFDALTSERAYKKAFSFEKALEIIRESTGTHFDPVVVEAFFNQLDEIKKIYNKNL